MSSGIFIIDKPAGFTSHDVVAKMRRILRERRIGHSGTLDPMATGVLPVFTGRATRAVEFTKNDDKEYIARIKLGMKTDTMDITGAVLKTAPVNLTYKEIDRALNNFRGEISQIPPMYSAVKIGGNKLYELARKGVEIPRQPRIITIYSLERLENSANPDEFFLRVHCSKGTYIRTLCNDLGEVLGCGGVLSELRRTKCGKFPIKHAVTLESLEQAARDGDAYNLSHATDYLFMEYPAVTVDSNHERVIKNGAAFFITGVDVGITYRVYNSAGEFLMLGKTIEERAGIIMKTLKSFYEV